MPRWLIDAGSSHTADHHATNEKVCGLQFNTINGLYHMSNLRELREYCCAVVIFWNPVRNNQGGQGVLNLLSRILYRT